MWLQPWECFIAQVLWCVVSLVSGSFFMVKLRDTHTASCILSVVIQCSQFVSDKPLIFAVFGFMRKGLCSHFSLVLWSSNLWTDSISSSKRTKPCVAFCACLNLRRWESYPVVIFLECVFYDHICFLVLHSSTRKWNSEWNTGNWPLTLQK